MDLYFQAALVLIIGGAFAYLLVIIMTPAQMFAPLQAETFRMLEASTDQIMNLGIQIFNNGVAVPGTSINTLIQNAEAMGLAVIGQTRASQGLTVNWGLQLRSATSTGVQIHAHGTTGQGQNVTAFEQNFVIPAADLFGVNQSGDPQTRQAGAAGLRQGPIIMGTNGTNTALTSGNAVSALEAYANLLNPASAPVGMVYGSSPWDDPLLMFWDPFSGSAEVAAQRGRTFSSTGYLITPQVIRHNMPANNNISMARTQGSVFHVNQGSLYHTSFIVSPNGDIIGIYFEEHGVSAQTAFLAAAMVSEGYINTAIQF